MAPSLSFGEIRPSFPPQHRAAVSCGASQGRFRLHPEDPGLRPFHSTMQVFPEAPRRAPLRPCGEPRP
eukprot:6688146-Alexandrium_andersonii.AAC.1